EKRRAPEIAAIECRAGEIRSVEARAAEITEEEVRGREPGLREIAASKLALVEEHALRDQAGQIAPAEDMALDGRVAESSPVRDRGLVDPRTAEIFETPRKIRPSLVVADLERAPRPSAAPEDELLAPGLELGSRPWPFGQLPKIERKYPARCGTAMKARMREEASRVGER